MDYLITLDIIDVWFLTLFLIWSKLLYEHFYKPPSSIFGQDSIFQALTDGYKKNFKIRRTPLISLSGALWVFISNAFPYFMFLSHAWCRN